MNNKGKLYEFIEEVRRNMNTPENMPCYIDDEMIRYWLDEARKELTNRLHIVLDNSKLLTTNNDNEEIVKALILSDVIMHVYREWVIEYFGDIE